MPTPPGTTTSAANDCVCVQRLHSYSLYSYGLYSYAYVVLAYIVMADIVMTQRQVQPTTVCAQRPPRGQVPPSKPTDKGRLNRSDLGSRNATFGTEIYWAE